MEGCEEVQCFVPAFRRNGRRWWDVQRMRLRSKGRVTVEHVAEAPSLAYARFMAGCDLVSGARP
jgi:hypothetical protein